jgi:hypothetical protein
MSRLKGVMGSLRAEKGISRPRWTAATRGAKCSDSYLNRSARRSDQRSMVGMEMDVRILLYHRDQMCRVGWSIDRGVGEEISDGRNTAQDEVTRAGSRRILART